MALEDVKLEQEPKTEFTEEQLQNIKDFNNNPVTQSLKIHLKEKLEKGKNSWLFGAFIPDDQKSKGDADAGYCQALDYILRFIETGGITDAGK